MVRIGGGGVKNVCDIGDFGTIKITGSHCILFYAFPWHSYPGALSFAPRTVLTARRTTAGSEALPFFARSGCGAAGCGAADACTVVVAGVRNGPDPARVLLPKPWPSLVSSYCQGRLVQDVIGHETLDVGRIGVRNSPDPGFFGQSLG